MFTIKQNFHLHFFLIGLCFTPIKLNSSSFSKKTAQQILPKNFFDSLKKAHAPFQYKTQVSWSKQSIKPITDFYRSITTDLYRAVTTDLDRTIGCIIITNMIALAKTHEKQQTDNLNLVIKKYGLTLCTDPEILSVFNTIKQDLGITEDVPLFISTDPTALGRYFSDGNMVYPASYKKGFISINLKEIGDDPATLIYIITHELGHYLQFNHFPRIYHNKRNNRFWKATASEQKKLENAIKLETSAEANAAGYQDCKDCLMHVKDKMGRAPQSSLHARGYFSTLDFNPYIERATEEKWSCPAHDNLRKQPFYKQASYMMGFNKPAYKLHQYLPSTYDRSTHSTFTMETD